MSITFYESRTMNTVFEILFRVSMLFMLNRVGVGAVVSASRKRELEHRLLSHWSDKTQVKTKG